jgi:hypothetical protein
MGTTGQDPQVDAKVEEIWRRIETDEAFRWQVVADREGTLRVAGLPEAALGRIQVQDRSDAEVAGYDSCVEISWEGGSRFWCRTPI